MNRNLILAIIAIIILAGGGIYLNSNRNKSAPVAVTQKEDVKIFTISASSFKFQPSEIRVDKGDRVKIVLNNTKGFHDWVIDEFDARTKQIQGPAKETVEFTADKTGTFEYYCSVGQHRQNGMVGKLIVE